MDDEICILFCLKHMRTVSNFIRERLSALCAESAWRGTTLLACPEGVETDEILKYKHIAAIYISCIIFWLLKMMELTEQQICIQFCFKVKPFLLQTIDISRKLWEWIFYGQDSKERRFNDASISVDNHSRSERPCEYKKKLWS